MYLFLYICMGGKCFRKPAFQFRAETRYTQGHVTTTIKSPLSGKVIRILPWSVLDIQMQQEESLLQILLRLNFPLQRTSPLLVFLPSGVGWGLLWKYKHYIVKGALSQGFLRFWVKNVLKFKINTFSCTWNTRTCIMSKEGLNRMIFSKGEQTIVSSWRYF